jgi:hypothetical protein
MEFGQMKDNMTYPMLQHGTTPINQSSVANKYLSVDSDTSYLISLNSSHITFYPALNLEDSSTREDND